MVKVAWLEKALTASKAVGRLVKQGQAVGTGFVLSGQDLFPSTNLADHRFVLTNNHVIESQSDVSSFRLELNYQQDVNGQLVAKSVYHLDERFFLSSPLSAFDFALVLVKDQEDQPISNFGCLQLEVFPKFTNHPPVNIIQHPEGRDKHIALTANEVISTYQQHLFYKADTLPGASGSPVFNQNWKVIALHHAGSIKDEQGHGGLVIDAAGTTVSANRGILIEHVLESIQLQFKARKEELCALFEQQSSTPIVEDIPSIDVLKLVILYDKDDANLWQELNKQFFLLSIDEQVQLFDIHQSIQHGVVKEQIKTALVEAHHIFTFITPNFWLKGYPWIQELIQANKINQVIPLKIIETPILSRTPLHQLKSYPDNEKFVSQWPDQDAAFAHIARAIMALVDVRLGRVKL